MSPLKADQPDWKQWWSDKTDAGARSESNIQKQARERLDLLDGGESLLDFGCGTAELLIHYAPHYARVIGADYSESMLAQARLRIQEGPYQHVRLLHADERSIWSAIDESFDRITSTQVIQHMDPEQVDFFIAHAAQYLNPGGKIALFDIIDPRLTTLRNLGFFHPENRLPQLSRVIVNKALDMSVANIKAKLKNQPSNIVGYAYDQDMIERMGRKANLDMEFARSMYIEDRYHAILSS
jgi:cyclopropane-fatty-acyl-phospholipid synthase